MGESVGSLFIRAAVHVDSSELPSGTLSFREILIGQDT